jgi:hypothetical protein
MLSTIEENISDSDDSQDVFVGSLALLKVGTREAYLSEIHNFNHVSKYNSIKMVGFLFFSIICLNFSEVRAF